MNTPIRAAMVERINALDAKHGTLTPELVVKDATSPKSPLHDYFEWDDDIAAHKFRLEQARTLIRSVEVRITVEDIEVRVPRYVRDPLADTDDQGYVDVERLRGNQLNSRRAMIYECDRAEACIDRARRLAVALGFAGRIDAIKAGIAELREMLREEKAA